MVQAPGVNFVKLLENKLERFSMDFVKLAKCLWLMQYVLLDAILGQAVPVPRYPA
jgi:hypothetical protein